MLFEDDRARRNGQRAEVRARRMIAETHRYVKAVRQRANTTEPSILRLRRIGRDAVQQDQAAGRALLKDAFDRRVDLGEIARAGGEDQSRRAGRRCGGGDERHVHQIRRGDLDRRRAEIAQHPQFVETKGRREKDDAPIVGVGLEGGEVRAA